MNLLLLGVIYSASSIDIDDDELSLFGDCFKSSLLNYADSKNGVDEPNL